MLFGRIVKLIFVGAFLAASVEIISRSDLFGSDGSEFTHPAGISGWVDTGVERATRAYRMLTMVNACEQPLAYRIGEFDERFNLTIMQAKRVIERAEQVWEEPTKRELFFYDDAAVFTINFIYDERQNETKAAQVFQNQLDQAANTKEGIDDTYRDLMERHDRLSAGFAIKKQNFTNQLNAYKLAVANHNKSGGASNAAYQRLNIEQKNLAAEQVGIDNMVSELNSLVDRINRVGDRNNQLVETYNQDVEVFNDRFGGVREFTQGDHQGDLINIYQFKDRNELTLVLAHELGHAMQLGHVNNEASIMYYLMGEQASKARLSDEDLEAFNSACE